MELFVAGAGTVIGLIGASVGIHSYRKQIELREEVSEQKDQQNELKSKMDAQNNEFEERNKREKELEELAESLHELREGLEFSKVVVEDPFSHPDINNNVKQTAFQVLAVHHSSGEEVEVRVERVTSYNDGERISLSSPKQAISELKKGNIVSDNTVAVGKDYGYQPTNVHTISEGVQRLKFIFDDIQDIRDNNKVNIDHFDPNLCDDIQDIMEELLIEIYSNLMEGQDGKDINPDEFDDIDALSYYIRNEFVGISKYPERIKEIDAAIERLEEVRKSVVEARYS